MRVNYELDNTGRIISCTKEPFNPELPYLEVDSVDDIIINDHAIVNGRLVRLGKTTQCLTEERIQEAYVELQSIQQWFNSTDWISNKITVGEWQPDDQRFLAYKQERFDKRARQDELNYLINRV